MGRDKKAGVHMRYGLASGDTSSSGTYLDSGVDKGVPGMYGMYGMQENTSDSTSEVTSPAMPSGAREPREVSSGDSYLLAACLEHSPYSVKTRVAICAKFRQLLSLRF